MNLPDLVYKLNKLESEAATVYLLEANSYSRKFGLELTGVEVQDLIRARNLALIDLGRVDTDLVIVKKIILAFCRSPYIDCSQYSATICELMQTFYLGKNLARDKIGDDELIAVMLSFFNGSCGGSTELLRDRELAAFIGILLLAQQ